jgi:hypothetical protein
VILADEVECGQIQIHPALQAAGNSNLNVERMLKVLLETLEGNP